MKSQNKFWNFIQKHLKTEYISENKNA